MNRNEIVEFLITQRVPERLREYEYRELIDNDNARQIAEMLAFEKEIRAKCAEETRQGWFADEIERGERRKKPHVCVFEVYNDADYGFVWRCDCGQLDPSRYTTEQRGL
jgi:hypothetical protein